MLKGGYKIVDLQDMSLSDQAVTIAGIYDSIEQSYQKALILSGINIGGVEKNDIYVELKHDDNSYSVVAYGYTITITSEDAVTAVAVAG